MERQTNRNDRTGNRFRMPRMKMPEKLTNVNYVNTAERVVLHLDGKRAEERFQLENGKYILCELSRIGKPQNFYLTTSKIRNLLSLLNVIYQMLQDEPGEHIHKQETLGKIQYFKMRCAYESGREKSVKDFVEKARLMEYVDDIGDSKKQFEIYFHYVESLVAYHRYYGGSEN